MLCSFILLQSANIRPYPSFILNNKLDKEEKLEKLMQNKVAFMMKM